jgi:IS5 family transposase
MAADELIGAAGPIRRLIADRGYDAGALRTALRAAGTTPIIPGRRSRRRPIRHEESRYKTDGESRRRSADRRSSAALLPAMTSWPPDHIIHLLLCLAASTDQPLLI